MNLTDKAFCAIGNIQHTIAMNSSLYIDELSALYELVKNIQEQNPTFITTEMNYKKNQVVIYGDGEGIDHNRMVEILKSLGASKKIAHHGIGLFAFFKYASRLLFFSKKDGIYYLMSLVPHSDGSRVYSDVGDPHPLDSAEQEKYVRYTCLLANKYHSGTVYVVEDIGTSSITKTNIASVFNMKDVFTRAAYIKQLREKCNYGLKSIHCFIDTDADSQGVQRIHAKTGHGKNFKFSIPSGKCPFPFTKDKTIFEFPNKPGEKFELTMEVDVWLGVTNSGKVYLTEDHQNGLSVDEAFGNSAKVNRKDSIFRANPLGQYLEGEISFQIYSRKGVQRDSVYTASRNSLMVGAEFGDKLANMINSLDFCLFRDLCKDLEQKQVDKSDQRLNKRYEDMLSDFLKAKLSAFDFLTKNEGGVPGKLSTRKCKLCGKECELDTRTTEIPAMRINRIFLRGSTYHCGYCNGEWEREVNKNFEYEHKDGGPTVPIYHSPEPDDAKQRERRHGFGYNVQFLPFSRDNVQRATFSPPSLIKINIRHPEYINIKNGSGGKKNQVLEFRNMSLMFTEIVNQTIKDPIQRLKSKDDLLCSFAEYQVQKKEVVPGESTETK